MSVNTPILISSLLRRDWAKVCDEMPRTSAAVATLTDHCLALVDQDVREYFSTSIVPVPLLNRFRLSDCKSERANEMTWSVFLLSHALRVCFKNQIFSAMPASPLITVEDQCVADARVCLTKDPPAAREATSSGSARHSVALMQWSLLAMDHS